MCIPWLSLAFANYCGAHVGIVYQCLANVTLVETKLLLEGNLRLNFSLRECVLILGQCDAILG